MVKYERNEYGEIIKYKKPYKKQNGYKHNNKIYRTTKRHLSKGEFRILWTAIWLLFIFALCLLFDNAAPLWFLIIWFIGVA